MILSVSRRTDIPRFYFDWFLNRLNKGFVLVRNPMNHIQVSHINLSPEVIDCIAFWTKNPAPMLGRLTELDPYPFFIQYTINSYGQDIEGGLPRKTELIETFKTLAHEIGPEKMIWRYSPILLSETYTAEYHLKYFEEIAKRLEGSTDTCRISFLDLYRKITRRMQEMGISEVPEETKSYLVHELSAIAEVYGISIGGCGNLDLKAVDLAQTGCIDNKSVSRAIGKPLNLGKDPGQRSTCYCVPSIDIGSYNTCRNGCVYCYANQMGKREALSANRYDAHSPMLCDSLRDTDKVTQRKVTSFDIEQLHFEGLDI